MSLKTKLRARICRSPNGKLLINYKRIIFQKASLLFKDDYHSVKASYKRNVGRELNLRNPERFTEKLQWLKLFYRNPLMPICADKVTIREYLVQKGYGEYLVPLAGKGVYCSVDEINFDEVPEKCVLKASNGSSMHLVKKGKITNKKAWKHIMKSWQKMNIYAEGREWPYIESSPKIICETFIEPKTDNRLKDYKFFCFNGTPKFIQVDIDLLSDHHINFFDVQWTLLPVRGQYPNSPDDVIKPYNFDKMILIARDLSKEFPHVRVDFYEYDNQLRIGELTFFDGSGYYNFNPDKYDFIFGKELKLPEPNHNLKLWNKITE